MTPSEQLNETLKAQIDSMTDGQRHQCHELIKAIRSLCSGLDTTVVSVAFMLVAAEIANIHRQLSDN